MKKNETLEGLMLRYNFNEADLLENAELMGFNAGHEWDKLKKYQIRKQLAAEVLSHPREATNLKNMRIFYEEWRMLENYNSPVQTDEITEINNNSSVRTDL